MTLDPVERLQADIADLRAELHRLGIADVRLEERLRGMEHDIDALRSDRERWVSVHEFGPVRRIVYGVVGLLGAGLLGAILNLILNPGGMP